MKRDTLRLFLNIILTIGALEFFGPALRDSDASHLQNPHWPGHAKVHMMWFIGYLFFSGVAQIYLIWLRKREDYPLVLGWQLCNLLGFWTAVLTAPLYSGAVVDPQYHMQILGINENLVAFTFFTVVWLCAGGVYAALTRQDRKTEAEPTHA